MPEPTKSPSGRAPRKSLRLHGTIARDLGVQIVSGRHRPGDLLEGEIAASGQLQVSRTAYREAVRILAAKGLVESKPKVGTRVSTMEHWHWLDPDVISWIFHSAPDANLIANLFELRKIVEPRAAALAALRRAPADIEQMRRGVEGMSQHSLAAEAGRSADQDFHAALLRATGNAFLSSLISGIGAAVAYTTIFKQRASTVVRETVTDHRKVYEAIVAGDANAAHAAMEELIDHGFQDTENARRAIEATHT
jgi:DNA-binding FadR family transcriptional regulator